MKQITGGEISIHAAREGGDLCACVGVVFIDISIHAAREGGDYLCPSRSACRKHFNPRRP